MPDMPAPTTAHGPVTPQARSSKGRGRRWWPAIATEVQETRLLWTLILILVAMWVLGLATNVVGGLIHALLVIAAIVLIYQLLTGRRVA